jgi:hypothetical protein
MSPIGAQVNSERLKTFLALRNKGAVPYVRSERFRPLPLVSSAAFSSVVIQFAVSADRPIAGCQSTTATVSAAVSQTIQCLVAFFTMYLIGLSKPRARD